MVADTQDAVLVAAAEGARTPPRPLRAFWLAFKENRGAVIGLSIVVLIVNSSLDLPLQFPATMSIACMLIGAIIGDYITLAPRVYWRWNGRIAPSLLIGMVAISLIIMLHQ